jgi:hypothetical protein
LTWLEVKAQPSIYTAEEKRGFRLSSLQQRHADDKPNRDKILLARAKGEAIRNSLMAKEARASYPYPNELPEGFRLKGTGHISGDYQHEYESSTERMTLTYKPSVKKWIEVRTTIVPTADSPDWKLVGHYKERQVFQTDTHRMGVYPDGTNSGIWSLTNVPPLNKVPGFVPVVYESREAYFRSERSDEKCPATGSSAPSPNFPGWALMGYRGEQNIFEYGGWRMYRRQNCDPEITLIMNCVPLSKMEGFSPARGLNMEVGAKISMSLSPTTARDAKELEAAFQDMRDLADTTGKPAMLVHDEIAVDVKMNLVTREREKCGNTGPRCEYGTKNPCTKHAIMALASNTLRLPISVDPAYKGTWVTPAGVKKAAEKILTGIKEVDAVVPGGLPTGRLLSYDSGTSERVFRATWRKLDEQDKAFLRGDDLKPENADVDYADIEKRIADVMYKLYLKKFEERYGVAAEPLWDSAKDYACAVAKGHAAADGDPDRNAALQLAAERPERPNMSTRYDGYNDFTRPNRPSNIMRKSSPQEIAKREQADMRDKFMFRLNAKLKAVDNRLAAPWPPAHSVEFTVGVRGAFAISCYLAPPKMTFDFPAITDGDEFTLLEDHVVHCVKVMLDGYKKKK